MGKTADTVENRQKTIFHKLHEKYGIRNYDNTDVWAGNMHLEVDGSVIEGDTARIFYRPGGNGGAPEIRVVAELYIRDVTDAGALEDGQVEARLWTDADRHGIVDLRGMHFPDPGFFVPMRLRKNPDGGPAVRGNNAVFISDPVKITETGVFSYTVMFSADGKPAEHPAKNWIAINDMAHNRDGVVVVIPPRIARCPSVMEVCARKYGASLDAEGRFVSGKLNNITEDIENIPVDIIYLLPVFLPGTGDILTGEDVRKGELGSIYAVRDFYRLDPAICSNPRDVDIKQLVSKNLLTSYDVQDLLDGRQQSQLGRVSNFLNFRDNDEIVDFLGEETATQLVGRAELRRLTHTAHVHGKAVIFDLVLMQTSRDCDLINAHREWYELDEYGAPKKHSIAWLDYSDVALFRLKFNKALQNYLSSIAPYWIQVCGLDGVRIDASQTVDKAFLKQIKNRINEVKPDAVVLGETLCPIHEAVGVPTDMIYSLLVDHHVNIEHAGPYYDLFETYHHTFPGNTVAMAYFENHDSARATARWHERFTALLEAAGQARSLWLEPAEKLGCDPALLMASLKSIQCSAINMISGSATSVNFSYAIENGTDFAEMTRTDFENKTVIDFSLRARSPGSELHECYKTLHGLKKNLDIITSGKVYYLRDNNAANNGDRIYALVRHDSRRRLVFLANLDPAEPRKARFRFDFLSLGRKARYRLEPLVDTYEGMGIGGLDAPDALSGRYLSEGLAELELMPLQAVVLELVQE